MRLEMNKRAHLDDQRSVWPLFSSLVMHISSMLFAGCDGNDPVLQTIDNWLVLTEYQLITLSGASGFHD